MASCFWGFRQEKKTVQRPRPLTLPLERSTSTVAPGKNRLDSIKSWSVLLDSQIGGGGGGEGTEEEEETEGATTGGAQPEWVADMSELFIGNRFASGSNSRIYRGIYKQRAVAVKMVRVPDNEDGSRPLIDSQFNSEVALLSRLRHPNVIENERPHIPNTCSPEFSNLVRQCWSADPAKRPDFDFIVALLEQYDEHTRNMPLIPQMQSS